MLGPLGLKVEPWKLELSAGWVRVLGNRGLLESSWGLP